MTGATPQARDDLEAVVAQTGDLRTRVLVLDFDGTLAPITPHPDDASLSDRVREVLAQLLGTEAAVVILSGRTVDDLVDRFDGLELPLVGGHGAEVRTSAGERIQLTDLADVERTLVEVQGELDRLLHGHEGWWVERKPHSVAVHFRQADGRDVDALLPDLRRRLRGYRDEPPGWGLLEGKSVLELRPDGANKSEAIRWISARYPGRTPLVIADDTTDEEAFRAAREIGGAGVLVTDRPRTTAARWRVETPERVVTLLRRLASESYDRRSPARIPDGGVPAEHPIEQYGLISDSRTAALISPDGSLDWMCLPRFDSPSVFAALLDPERGGRWRIRPTDRQGLTVQRTYLGDTNVLITRFVRDGDPILTLTDFLTYSRVNAFDPTHTGHILCRRIEAFGPVEAEIDLQPRFDYGRARTRLDAQGAWVRAEAGSEHIDVEGPDGITWEVAEHDGGGEFARATLALEGGDDAWFVLRTSGAEQSPHRHLSPDELLDLTVRTWGRWSNLIDYEGPWRDAVVRSALVLKGLVYEPTGALVAAPTTSLPESFGGERNWDYRFSWIRDSAYVLECFLLIGHAREAETFIRWLSELSERIGGAQELRPLYRVTGEEDLTEFELTHLSGYRGSTPVRVGNGASTQVQLDIYGAAMQLGYLTEQLGGEVPAAQWDVISQLVDTVRQRWRDPDSGLWEIRSEPRHHTFSKFQCWLAVDRAIRIGRNLGLQGPYEAWEELAGEIADDVLEHGYDQELRSFVQAYGSRELDGSVLLLPLRGFIPPEDDRVRHTVEAVREALEVADGLLVRYRSEDGLHGEEGAFLMCSFWLVELLARMGDLDEAERLFERLLSLAGPLGLYAEEIDPVTHAHLGNFPQGFTHMGLIAAATAIAEESWR